MRIKQKAQTSRSNSFKILPLMMRNDWLYSFKERDVEIAFAERFPFYADTPMSNVWVYCKILQMQYYLVSVTKNKYMVGGLKWDVDNDFGRGHFYVDGVLNWSPREIISLMKLGVWWQKDPMISHCWLKSWLAKIAADKPLIVVPWLFLSFILIKLVQLSR